MLGIQCYKIIDDSLSPLITKHSYVFTWKWLNVFSFKENDIVVIKHKHFGYVVKKIAIRDRNKLFWCISEGNKGLPIEQFGPIHQTNIIGKVRLVVSSPF